MESRTRSLYGTHTLDPLLAHQVAIFTMETTDPVITFLLLLYTHTLGVSSTFNEKDWLVVGVFAQEMH